MPAVFQQRGSKNQPGVFSRTIWENISRTSSLHSSERHRRSRHRSRSFISTISIGSALCAAAFCAPLAAYSVGLESDLAFPVIMRIGVLPLTLFSGTFFPISQLPDWLRPLAALSPLWHGVELARHATTGSLHLGADVVHISVLVACTGAGLLWGRRTFARRLTA